MKANAEKCHLLVTRDNDVTAKIEEFDVKNSREEKLFAVKIDTIFSFENHFPSLYKKAKPNLHAFPGIVNFADLANYRSLMKAFITTLFSYCPIDPQKSFETSIQGTIN